MDGEGKNDSKCPRQKILFQVGHERLKPIQGRDESTDKKQERKPEKTDSLQPPRAEITFGRKLALLVSDLLKFPVNVAEFLSGCHDFRAIGSSNVLPLRAANPACAVDHLLDTGMTKIRAEFPVSDLYVSISLTRMTISISVNHCFILCRGLFT